VERTWPFLLRFPIGCFGICLGLASQAILWKALAGAATMRFARAPGWVHTALWAGALATFAGVSGTYAAKCALYFEAVRREFRHPVRANFFFAPWIAAMFLALGAPQGDGDASVKASIASTSASTTSASTTTTMSTPIHAFLWALFITPVLALELHMYGEWLSGGHRRLSEVVNPSAQLSLLANFAGALLAASAGWPELATFFWAVGLAHYVVLFVTLYQRLPTAAVVPKELHPVFFLFVAAPSSASLAWARIVGRFDLVSRITYFIGLFLYSALVSTTDRTNKKKRQPR
jgi:tellurite resistance protein TehA-like permease